MDLIDLEDDTIDVIDALAVTMDDFRVSRRILTNYL